MTFSPELTFIMAKAPHEITNAEMGGLMVTSICKELSKRSKSDVLLVPKLDPMHNIHEPNQTYCIEVTPAGCCCTEWLDNDKEWKLFKYEIDLLFAIMKEHGFVPTLTRRRGDTELHYPGGGCHIHVGAHLFSWTPDLELWYDRMKLYHRNLLTDYANRPYIRWLFSHWFADLGSSAYITLDNLEDFKSRGANVMEDRWRPSTIEARYMNTTKGAYLTFEHRYFSMIENAEEMRLIARFAWAWMQYVKGQQFGEDFQYKEQIPFTLTADQLRAMQKPREAKVMCHEFFAKLGLPWDDYSHFFDRNYLRRIKWGKFV